MVKLQLECCRFCIETLLRHGKRLPDLSAVYMPAGSQGIGGMLKADQHLDKHPDNSTQQVVISKLRSQKYQLTEINTKYSDTGK